jgi:hypothetical protein
MNTFIALIALVIAIPGAIVELNKLVPAQNRRRIVSSIGDLAEGDNVKNIGNTLTNMAAIGTLIMGFVVSYCLAGAFKFSGLGLYVGMFSFSLFALFVLYIVENCKWK